jgi:hypothetical protein
MLLARQNGIERPKKWYQRLKNFFEKRFGDNWMDELQKSGKNIDWMDFDA